MPPPPPARAAGARRAPRGGSSASSSRARTGSSSASRRGTGARGRKKEARRRTPGAAAVAVPRGRSRSRRVGSARGSHGRAARAVARRPLGGGGGRERRRRRGERAGFLRRWWGFFTSSRFGRRPRGPRGGGGFRHRAPRVASRGDRFRRVRRRAGIGRRGTPRAFVVVAVGFGVVVQPLGSRVSSPSSSRTPSRWLPGRFRVGSEVCSRRPGSCSRSRPAFATSARRRSGRAAA